MSACPRCGSPLEPSEYEGATVHCCGRCRGQWLGPAELKQIVDSRKARWDPDRLAALRATSARRVPLGAVREELPCPECGGVMDTFNYGGDSGVLLDKCPACGGIWLDGGELEKVQTAVESAERARGADSRWFGGPLREAEVREDARELRDRRSVGPPPITALVESLLDTD
jgi:Zn-finger nucleic acid-binding protein